MVNLLGLSGAASGNLGVSAGMLIGDTTADRVVNSADISQTKARSNQIVGAGNFRNDVTADGNLNSADVGLVKSKSNTSLSRPARR